MTGFRIALYTNQTVSGARSLAIGGNSSQPIVYASSNGAGVVSLLWTVFSNLLAVSSQWLLPLKLPAYTALVTHRCCFLSTLYKHLSVTKI